MSERTMELWWTGRPRSRPRTLLPYDGAETAEVTGQPVVGEHAARRVRGRASVIDMPVVLAVAVWVAVMVISTGLASSRRIGARARTRALGICASRLSAR
jgi:hypothetical protein